MNLQDIEGVTCNNRDTKMAKKQRLYLKLYCNGPRDATALLNKMI